MASLQSKLNPGEKCMPCLTAIGFPIAVKLIKIVLPFLLEVSFPSELLQSKLSKNATRKVYRKFDTCRRTKYYPAGMRV